MASFGKDPTWRSGEKCRGLTTTLLSLHCLGVELEERVWWEDVFRLLFVFTALVCYQMSNCIIRPYAEFIFNVMVIGK